jgi:hypothetical protein
MPKIICSELDVITHTKMFTIHDEATQLKCNQTRQTAKKYVFSFISASNKTSLSHRKPESAEKSNDHCGVLPKTEDTLSGSTLGGRYKKDALQRGLWVLLTKSSLHDRGKLPKIHLSCPVVGLS